MDFHQAELPSILMAIDGALDITNFLGRFAIWVLIALCISIYSNDMKTLKDVNQAKSMPLRIQKSG